MQSPRTPSVSAADERLRTGASGPAGRRGARTPRSGGTAEFAELAAPVERAAMAIGRLDVLLRGHPLSPAWAWRTRLEAVRRQAAADGRMIDPWQLAAVVEGVRFRLGDGGSLAERGAVLDAARHAFGLWRWFVHPDAEQAAAIAAAAATFPRGGRGSVLLGVAATVHRWLDRDGARAPIRAALAGYWQRCGLLPVPTALLTGARALAGRTPWAIDAWTVTFLEALIEEAEFGLGVLRQLERQWFTARAALAGRRRDSRAAVAVDVLAAAPVISATSLAEGVGVTIKAATALLDDLVARGLAIEVSRRAKRRLFGLAYLAPLRAEAAAPRRPVPGRGRGRPAYRMLQAGNGAAEAADTIIADPALEPLALPALTPRERVAFDFTDLDRYLREADAAIRRTWALLEQRADAPHRREHTALQAGRPNAEGRTPTEEEDDVDRASWSEPPS